jgi:uncharacterized peroxidase-related enzyme
MRLKEVERPHSLLQKVRNSLMRTFMGDIPGPILAMSYGRDLGGKHLARCYQDGLRQAREWSAGELEIFAAFVANLNRCQYCIASHSAITQYALGSTEHVQAVLADWRTAPISSRLRGALQFLEKLTLTPGEIGRDDADAARAAGVSDLALREAIYVCFLISTMTRLADALDFALPDPQTLQLGARMLARFGYRGLRV